jgi:hypothetical protein
MATTAHKALIITDPKGVPVGTWKRSDGTINLPVTATVEFNSLGTPVYEGKTLNLPLATMENLVKHGRARFA